MTARHLAWLALIGGCGATLATTSAAPAAAPRMVSASARVSQLVVFRNGRSKAVKQTAARASVQVGRKNCAVPAGTPLAVLILSRPGRISLHDFGSCSTRPADAVGLFVDAIARDRNRGQDGWVYKVGTKLATAGAADPAGPFGNGRLRNGAEVAWFYCHRNARTRSCQPTLGLSARTGGSGSLRVMVRAYDDRGRATPAAGASVHANGAIAKADRGGEVTLTLARGRAHLFADGRGAIRSFEAIVDVT